MSCYRCAEKFRFFKKELGCPNCGFSFCSKCLNCRIKVPKRGDQILSVCQKCHDSLKNEVDKNSKIKDFSPPKNFIKMVEENRNKIVETKNPQKDIELRLGKLKNDQPKRSLPDCSDLEARINKLQDRDEKYSKLSNLPSKELVNTPEDLISKLTDEVQIDQNYEQYEKRELEKLEERLKNLKNGLNLNFDTPKEQDLEISAKKNSNSNESLVKKMLQDAEFSLNQNDEEDLWCCLCNDDASIKCSDCDDDLYCKRCFKQTHSSGEYKYHNKSIINSN